MKIRKINCKRFAGLTDRTLEFVDGLNVILGPNEAGKSTLVEGILASLFRNQKLTLKTAKDKEFAERFFPYPGGDHAACELTLGLPEGEVRICRGWSHKQPEAELIMNGISIKDDLRIGQALSEILGFGEGTYSGIVFARQNEIRSVFERISSDPEISETVGGVLRRAVMELDGVNVDKLSRKLDEQIRDYGARWDLEGNRPEGNRGIHNKYTKGVGKVLAAWNEMEEWKEAKQTAKATEDEIAKATDELHRLNGDYQTAFQKIRDYERIEPSLVERAGFIGNRKSLETERDTLKILMREWPEATVSLSREQDALSAMTIREAVLQKELDRSKAAKEIKEAMDFLAKVAEKDTEVLEKKKALAELERFSDERINRINQLHREILTCNAALEAATLITHVVSSSKPIKVTAGMGDSFQISSGETRSFNGYMRVEMEGLLELEIRAGEIDFESIRDRFDTAVKEQNDHLQTIGCSSSEEAEAGNRRMKTVAADLRNLEGQLLTFKGDRDPEALRAKVLSSSSVEGIPARDSADLEAELAEVSKNRRKSEMESYQLTGRLESWEKQYGNWDKAIERYAEVTAEIKTAEKRLAELPPLPEGFNDPQEFLNELKSIRVKKENIDQQRMMVEKGLITLNGNLPELSYEELELLHKEGEARFDECRQRLNRLHLIRKSLEHVKADLDRTSSEPLVRGFSAYLCRITDGRYEKVDLDCDYSIGISSDGKTSLPSRLLSAGTLDAVALAFKFALLDLLFPEGQGFAVLDDCLVNMDPQRRKNAAAVIGEYSKRNQVLFTTCSPEIAGLLGGNTINI